MFVATMLISLMKQNGHLMDFTTSRCQEQLVFQESREDTERKSILRKDKHQIDISISSTFESTGNLIPKSEVSFECTHNLLIKE
jgi:hypothetical protein